MNEPKETAEGSKAEGALRKDLEGLVERLCLRLRDQPEAQLAELNVQCLHLFRAVNDYRERVVSAHYSGGVAVDAVRYDGESLIEKLEDAFRDVDLVGVVRTLVQHTDELRPWIFDADVRYGGLCQNVAVQLAGLLRERKAAMSKETMGLWRKNGIAGGKYLVQRRDGTVPEWPLFVLGARDPAAAIALRAYATACEGQGRDPRYVDNVRELANDFDTYRAERGDGDPDAAPVRADDPAIVAKMQVGGSA